MASSKGRAPTALEAAAQPHAQVVPESGVCDVSALMDRLLSAAASDRNLERKLRAKLGVYARSHPEFARDLAADLAALSPSRGRGRPRRDRAPWALWVATVRTLLQTGDPRFQSVEAIAAYFSDVWRESGAIPELALAEGTLRKLYFDGMRNPDTRRLVDDFLMEKRIARLEQSGE